MQERTCSKCGETKPLSEFHRQGPGRRHPRCKTCRRTEEHRRSRQKAGTPERLATTRAYYQRSAEQIKEAQRVRRRERPEVAKARGLVQYAVRTGALVPEPCLFCDEPKVDAHHHNYSLPLDVTWLCKKHHGLVHREADQAAGRSI